MSHRIAYSEHARALLALGLPLVGSHLAGLFIHMTDTVMLGWYGVEELAAVVLGGTFWFVLFIVGSGFGTALAAPVAAAVAQGDETQVRRLARMAMWLSLIYALLVSPVFLFAEPILLGMGQKPRVAELAGAYLMIAGWSIIPNLLVNLLRSLLSALNRTRVILMVTLSALVLHAVLNWVLIFGNLGFPELGIRGAAISTMVTDALMAAVLMTYAVRSFPHHRLLSRIWRPDFDALARVFHLGWPISLQMMAEVGMFASAALMMGRFGAEVLAAHGIALQLASITFLFHLGLANAATIRVGQAYGVRDTQALRDGALTGVMMSVGFALLTMTILLAMPRLLLGVFLDPTDPATPAVIVAGVTLVTMAAIFQLADGGQAMAIGLLRGIQDMRVPTLIAVVSYWVVGIPVGYGLAFGLGFGAVGVWAGLVIGLAVVWVALSMRFWGGAVRRLAAAAPLVP